MRAVGPFECAEVGIGFGRDIAVPFREQLCVDGAARLISQRVGVAALHVHSEAIAR